MLVLLLIAPAAWTIVAQQTAPPSVGKVREHYTKYEYRCRCATACGSSRPSTCRRTPRSTYPFLITRTPYSVARTASTTTRTRSGRRSTSRRKASSSSTRTRAAATCRKASSSRCGRSRPDKRAPKDIDESTDTYDTIDWLLKNVPNNNGRVGMVGISQPGFHVAASIINAHPALKAASPQAPTADYYMGDDVYHNGAFMLGGELRLLFELSPARADARRRRSRRFRFDPARRTCYEFFLRMPPLARSERASSSAARPATGRRSSITPTYDEFWKARSLWQFMDDVNCAVLNVGGWFDAEDPIGPLHIYRSSREEERRAPTTCW